MLRHVITCCIMYNIMYVLYMQIHIYIYIYICVCILYIYIYIYIPQELDEYVCKIQSALTETRHQAEEYDMVV